MRGSRPMSGRRRRGGSGGTGMSRGGWEGVANARIGTDVGTTTSVWKWRNRYVEAGLEGLADAPRSGRPKHLDHAGIVAATLQAPPDKYGVTHWSSRLLAHCLGVGNATLDVDPAIVQLPRLPRGRERDGRAGVAGIRGAAVEVGDVQVFHRSGVGGEGYPYRGPVSRAAREHQRARRGREVSDPGVGSDRADAADADRRCRETHPRLQTAWHDDAVGRVGGRDRPRHWRGEAEAPPAGVPCANWTAPTRSATCTW